MVYATSFIRNEKKRKCTQCDCKLVDGRQVVVALDCSGKRKAYLCSDSCCGIFLDKGVNSEKGSQV